MIMTPFRYNDATVVGLSMADRKINLDLECCTENDDLLVEASIVFHDVSQVMVDGTPTANISMLEADGEIISYVKTMNHAQIIIEWNDFNPENMRNYTVVYAFDFADAELSRSPDLVREP